MRSIRSCATKYLRHLRDAQIRSHKPRRLWLEPLEARQLLAVDWRNPADALDVSGDGFVVAGDALAIVNDINTFESRFLDNAPAAGGPFLDPTGDQFIAPDDALTIINAINSGLLTGGVRALRETGRLDSEASVTITLGQFDGNRIYRARVDADFDTTDQQTAIEDLLTVYLVNPLDPQDTLIDRGAEGTTLFTLAGTQAEFAPGIVRWDGSVLEVDLTNIESLFGLLDTGLLKFELLSSDSDFGSRVTITPLSNEVIIGDSLDIAFPSSLIEPAGVGAELNISALPINNDIELLVENVRLDPITARYQADVRLRNNGAAVGRDVAAIFRGLALIPGFPIIAAVETASGLASNDDPYINFHNAIPSGGLTQGMTSDPITVSIFDPNQVVFFIRPEIRAGINHAPTINAIGPLTVMPGSVLTVPLAATDSDGDTVTFTVKSSQPLPTGELTGGGKLIFRPSPAQLGTYTFDVVASDGAAESKRTVTLNVVTDPVTTTRVSGTILQTNGQPLANVRIDIGNVQVLTAANGTFTANLGTGPVVSDTLKVRGELVTGATTYPFIAEKLAFVLEHPVYEHYNNVIVRPIYLPGLDNANAVQINPAQDTTVTTAAIPGASVMVKAGTLLNQQGTPFTGKLSITEVPRELTPAALPNGMRPDLVVTIQPGEMVFASPAPLSFPNRGNYPPGTVMELWSINPVSGEFDKVGISVVSPDGSTIDTVSGGIRNSSWHFPVLLEPIPDIENPNNEDNGCDECKITGELTSEVELHSGAVIERHNLVTYQADGSVRGVSLVYDSLRADPRPIIYFSAEQEPDTPPNCATSVTAGPCFIGAPIPTPDATTRYVAQFSVQNGEMIHQVPGYTGDIPGLGSDEHFWTYSSTEHVEAALQADLRSFPSGIFPYTVRAGFLRGDAGSFTGSLQSTRSQVTSVNSIDSPFGAGWGLAGLQTIISSRNTALLIDGDGSELHFGGGGDGTYASPPGDFTTLERENGLFRRTTPDQTVYQFNADNQIAAITDRNGNVTTYHYLGKLLQKITDSVGLETTFTYTGGRVTKITDPAGRITTLTYDPAGNLASITDPDSAKRTWGYDADHHIISEVDQLGRRETTEYGFHGRAIGGVKKDGRRIEVSPAQTQGLLRPEKTRDPINSPPVIERNSPQASYLDANGTIRATPLDQQGQALASRDRFGQLPSVSRDANNLPITMLDGRGNPTLQEFDRNGMLTMRRDSVSGGGSLTGSITPAGEIDRYTFNGRAGQRLFIDGPQGSFNSGLSIADSSERFSNGADTFFDTFGLIDFHLTVLPRDDVYTVTVGHAFRDHPQALKGATGSYRARLVDVDEAPDLPLNTPLTGTLTQRQFYQVEGQRGQSLRIVDQLGAFGPGFGTLVFDPEGGQVLGTLPDANTIYSEQFLMATTGTYTVMLFGYTSQPTAFQLQASLIDAPPIPKQGLNVDHMGTLPDEVTFSAPAGTPILFYWTDKGAHRASIYDSVSFQSLLNVHRMPGVFTVPRSGSFTAYVEKTFPSYTDETDEYAVRFVDLSAVGLIPLGATVNGTLAQDSHVAAYRFQGQAGQRIDFGQTQEGIFVRLFKGQFYDVTAEGTVTLPHSGEYNILVGFATNASAPKNFSISPVLLPAITPISLDTTVSGQLTPGSGRRYFQLDASEGDILYFEDLGSSTKIRIRSQELDGDARLFRENFQNLPTLADAEDRFTVDRSGRYVIILDADEADRPASYSFKIHSPKTNIIPLTLGQATQSTFAEPIQTNVHTFNGTAGQQLFFDQLNAVSAHSANLDVALLGPAGDENLLSNGFFDSQRMIVIPATGQYRLELHNRVESPAAVTFRLIDVASAPLVAVAAPQAGTINPADEDDLYRFNATAGQRLKIDLTIGEGAVFPTLFYPTGEPLSVAFGDPITLPITHSGSYAISWRVPNAGPSPYEFVINDVSDTPVTPADIDHVYSGTGTGAEVTVGTFSGNAGTLIFFDARLGPGGVRVFDATNNVILPLGGFGTTVTANLSFDSFFVLPASGAYTVKVEATGDFSFRLQPANAAPLFNFEQNVAGSLDATGITDLYRVNIASGKNVVFDPTAGGTDVVYTFYTPTASQDFGFGLLAPSQQPTTVFIAGTYFLAVSRNFDTGAYGFQLHDFNAVPSPIELEEPVTGAANPAAQMVFRRFQGAAGQKVYLNSSGGLWELYDALGEYVSAVFDAGIFTLPAAGAYTLKRDNDDLTDTAEFTVTLNALEDPLVAVEPAYLSSTALVMDYDPDFNQLARIVDELGHTTLFDIDPANGNTRSMTRVVGAVGGDDDQVTTMTYTTAGLIDTMTDPLGRVTDYDYDNRRRLITVTSAKGTPSQTVVRYEYDTAGNVSAYIDENNHRALFEYDVLNRLKKITEPDPDGAGPLTSPVTLLTYDAAGNQLTITDANGRTTSMVYDALDRIKSMTDPGNNSTKYAYDSIGNLLSVTDPLNHATQYRYDIRNRLTESIDPAGNVTKYKYDLSDNLILLTDASGNITQFEYDARNRLTRRIDPLGKAVAYTYDGVDNLIKKTDRLGRVTELSYDDLNRPVQQVWRNTNGSIANTTTYAYDKTDNLRQAQDNFSTATFAYDPLNRVIQTQTGGTSTPSATLAYTYDAAGNVLSVVDTINGVAGGTNTYAYDALDRVTRMIQTGNSVAAKRVDMQYDSRGQMTSLARFSDVAGASPVAASTFVYDTLNRISSITHRNAANSLLNSFVFQYDDASRITRITDIDGATDYAYDIRDELTRAGHTDPANPDEIYLYDATGNRLLSHKHAGGYAIGDGSGGAADNNRLTSDGTFNYTYDDEGNLVKRVHIATGAVRDLTYDHRNRLIQVTDRPSAAAVAQIVKYTYDLFDRRIAKNIDTSPADAIDGVITSFVYDGDNILVEYHDPDGAGPAASAEAMRYLHGPAVDQVLAQEDAAGAVHWHLTDHLGTIRDLVSNSGQVVNHLKYDSYGNVISESNTAISIRYRFTGREFDAETGLMYYRARYYDATLGRFISEDPIGFLSGDPNLFAYVKNQSVLMKDPSGNTPLGPIALLGAFAGASGNLAGQLLETGKVDVGELLIAGASGAGQSVVIATGPAGRISGMAYAVGVGVAGNLLQTYVTKRLYKGECATWTDYVWSAVTGALGGGVGGAAARSARPKVRMWEGDPLKPSVSTFDPKGARRLARDRDLRANLTPKRQRLTFAGSAISNTPRPDNVYNRWFGPSGGKGSGDCDCK